ncbi:regulatory protein [Streptomyces albireticuli]|uniref:Regulatory protein n=1 Tax=Streptomyces albireticuli TaxID=1940 RepID=A0A1Z2KVG4_9ACTN|nr:hypothetical protein [Streptomyces albireticuli]ARZ66043.1 regulatory protein [Streptomyces albireticuli]
MPDAQLETNGIKEQYAFKVAADLEHNTKEQERIGAEVTALEEQLRALRRDHTLLVSVQQALGKEGAAAAASRKAGDTATLPKPRPAAAEAKPARRRKATTTKAATTKAPAAKATKNSARTTGAKADTKVEKATKTERVEKTEKAETPEKAGKTATADTKAAGPTLVSLVREALGRQSEPRSAAEIAAAVAEAQPDRTIKPTVVRTTVEGLVAKGQAQRTKQGTSVFYAAPDGSPAAPAEPSKPAGSAAPAEPAGGTESATA